MKTDKKIRSQKDLDRRLKQLEEEKTALEKNIIQRGSEVYSVITDPAPIIKKAAKDLASDRDFRSDVFNIALSMAANYIGRKVSGSNTGRQATETIIDKLFGNRKNENEEPPVDDGWIQRIIEVFRKKDKDQKEKS